ncbi:MAG TPA: acyl-CoA dehydratase activase [Candidatus Eisenbacteria bacterium]|nr:acyl-CoA dehydratase activase [Candidatus Eisenbacteria bacterium]
MNGWAMRITAGIDVGSTYTKVLLLREDRTILGRAVEPTGFRLAEVAEGSFERLLQRLGLERDRVGYVVATGYGRHQASFADVKVTDLTASARGARFLFAGTQTVLDVGGQTMKATRIDETGKVKTFRLNDKCAAGTGAFLEKTARYLGYATEEIGPLVATSKEYPSISGVCAVFAESEVINHLSQGVAPADIMHGAIVSLVGRSVQLMKRARMGPEYTLIGGILRFETMARVARESLSGHVNVPDGDLPQFVTALGAAWLGQQRMAKIAKEGSVGARTP